MNKFDYYNPTRILFGKDRLGELDKVVPANARVLIIYGGGSVKKYGTLSKVQESLGDRVVFEFGGVEPNPRFETLMKAVAIAKEEAVDFLLAVGGGSVLDGTKFVAIASKYEGEDAAELLKYGFAGPPVEEALPIGTVLTLPATGSEMNSGAVISYEKAKWPILHPLMFPQFSFLDPELTMTLPKAQVANGIVDAFIHVVEQYVTVPVDARFVDRTAEGILQTLIEVGPKTLADPDNYAARANMMWCATMALNGLIATGVPQDWTTHMIGHELTAMFGIDHGKTLAIIQPAVWKVRKEMKRAKLLQYAERVWGITEGSEDQRIDQGIERTTAFFEELGVATHLQSYGISASQIDAIVSQLEKHGMTALSESHDVTLEVSREILLQAM